MKAICKNCAQREVGCFEECADVRAERAQLKGIKAVLFGKQKKAAIKTNDFLYFAEPQTLTINDLADAATRLAYVPLTIRR